MGLIVARLLEEIRVVVPSVVNVSESGTLASVKVFPSNLQASAQATINAYDTSQAADDLWQARLDNSIIGKIVPAFLNGPIINSTVTLQDVGIGWQLAPNTRYMFDFTVFFSAALATTGIALAINGPASPGILRFSVDASESATAVRRGAQTAYNTAVIAANSGGATILPAWAEGAIQTGATPGRLDLRFASEVAGSAVTIQTVYGKLYPVG